jgi:hypothetical protein
LRAIESRSVRFSSHLGVGRLLRALEAAGCARAIGVLLEWNVLALVADVDLQAALSGRDRQPLISELSDDVEGFSRWLLECEPEFVRLHRTFDLGTHVRGSLEEAVRRYEPVERLVRPLEVVVANEVLEPVLRVDDVREHCAPEKLVPQRLPESLDLAKRLRMLRPTTDVLHAHAGQKFLELGLAAPHRVLPPVVRQHLGRRTVRGDGTFECLHHQRRLLVMREGLTHDESAVVVHEHAHVQPLCAPQPKREDVRLPQLVRCRALEPPWRVLALLRRRRRLDQPRLVKNPPHLLLAHAEPFEPRQHVADPPCAPRLVFTLERHDLLAHHRVPQWAKSRLAASLRTPRLQCARTLSTKRRRPFLHGGRRHPERRCDVLLRRPLHPFLNHQQLVRRGNLSPVSRFLALRHPVSGSADLRQRCWRGRC